MAPSKFLDLHGVLHIVQAQQVQATYGVLEKGDTRGDLAKLVGKWWRGRGGEPTHLQDCRRPVQLLTRDP